MEELLEPARIANSILIDTSRKDTVVLVEGVNDNLLFSKFIEKERCEIKIAFGYQKIYEVLDILKASGEKVNVIGIVDQDFIGIHSPLPTHSDIFFVDCHDVEMMAFNSRSLELLFLAYGDEAKIKSITTDKSIREIFIEAVHPISLLKYINYRYSIGLSFKPKKLDGNRLKFDFFDHKTLELTSLEKMIEIVYNYNLGKTTPAINREDCKRLLETHYSESHDPSLFCNGHDICRLISIGLRKFCGNLGSKSPSEDELEQRLVLGYDSMEFVKTNIYANLKEYEARTGYLVLSI